MSRTIFVLSVLSIPLTSVRAEISMNDVTLLLPIPKTLIDLKTNYFNPSTTLMTGSLVSSTQIKLFDWNGVKADVDMRVRTNFERLAALGIRLDPCFKDQFTDHCRPQVRLVLQPITFGGAQLDTADTGIHLFFDTTEAQITELVQFAAQYREQFLGKGSYKAILQVHPVVQQEGINGKFWQAMRLKIQNVLNQAKPSRIAFLSVDPQGRRWTFRSFDLNAGVATPVQIHGINNVTQRIDNQTGSDLLEFISNESGLPRSSPATDQTFDFLRDSSDFRRSGNSRLSPLVNSMERIENPNTHLPGTIDCLSCHSTPSIKRNLRVKSNALQLTAETFMSKTFSRAHLFNLTENSFEGRDFRLFGYREGHPIIGQRVINESAAVADHFNSLPQL